MITDPTAAPGPLADWKALERQVAFQNRHLTVAQTVFQTPTRPRIPWTVVERKDAVAVAPITRDGAFVLLRQERPPVCDAPWEFPAGQVDLPSGASLPETLAETVRRELEEETGFALEPGSGELLSLGHFYTSPGYSSERVFLFAAVPVVPLPHGPRPEHSEAILEIRAFPPREVRRLVQEEALRDGASFALLSRLATRGLPAGFLHPFSA